MTMKPAGWVVTIVIGMSGVCEARQAAPAPAAEPQQHQLRAAGMPLRDGTLPPGQMTVRVVQGGFANNLANQVVTVEVLGGRSETATTGGDGRASFAHLPIGGSVRAVVNVNGEQLASDVFPVPAESGVRVLLISGATAGAAAAMPPAAARSPAPALFEGSVPPGTTQVPPRDGTMTAIRLIWVGATICCALYVTRPWWRS
jgi:hypothetical protein